MIILGLTGSIGMGKSTAAEMLQRMGLPLHDSDRAVHRLLAEGGEAVGAVAAAFDGVLIDGVIDRKRLGAQVFADADALARLEAILHPLVRTQTLTFLRLQARRRTSLVVLDIPLLFETGGEALCDVVAVVTTRPFLQAQRCLARPGMTLARLEAVRAQQMPDSEKCRRADFVVETGLHKGHTLRQLRKIVITLQSRYKEGPRRWPDVLRLAPASPQGIPSKGIRPREIRQVAGRQGDGHA